MSPANQVPRGHTHLRVISSAEREWYLHAQKLTALMPLRVGTKELNAVLNGACGRCGLVLPAAEVRAELEGVSDTETLVYAAGHCPQCRLLSFFGLRFRLREGHIECTSLRSNLPLRLQAEQSVRRRA